MVREIIINNFKNFDLLKASFNQINIIKGKNGAGKTNLIEAIFISLNGHPFLRSYKPIQKNVLKPAIITATLENDRVVLIKFDNKGKILKLNSKPTTVIRLKREFPCIDYSLNSFISLKSKEYMFSLLDRGIHAEDKEIINELVEYNKLQRIKRNMLKENFDIRALNTINEKVISISNKISEKRTRFTNLINVDVKECFYKFYSQNLDLKYKSAIIDKDIFELEAKKRKVLLSLKRDNLDITINGRKIQFSSVGERKIALLCVVLSIVKVYNEKSEKPVFLVDDLEGDLDREAQEKAFDTITSLPNQIFLTTLGAFEGYNTIDLGGLS